MKINVIDIPNCTWELEGDTFFCTHDEFEVIESVQDHMGFNGHYQTESLGYICSECEEPLDGSPEEDSIDEDFEYERLREYR